jgi:PIN domain nuclease of toxin-antitoxin system
VLVSAATLWELSLKHRQGQLQAPLPFRIN